MMWGKGRVALVLVAFGLHGCAPHLPNASPDTIHLISASFPSGAAIPIRFTCTGSNVSPPLSWTAVPRTTQSLALVVTDRDSPLQFVLGPFVHWIAYDLPPDTRQLRANVRPMPSLADGTHQGINGFGNVGYGGPCPPGGSSHRYAFTVYALDEKPDLPSGVKLGTLAAAMDGHIVAQGTLVGHDP